MRLVQPAHRAERVRAGSIRRLAESACQLRTLARRVPDPGDRERFRLVLPAYPEHRPLLQAEHPSAFPGCPEALCRSGCQVQKGVGGRPGPLPDPSVFSRHQGHVGTALRRHPCRRCSGTTWPTNSRTRTGWSCRWPTSTPILARLPSAAPGCHDSRRTSWNAPPTPA